MKLAEKDNAAIINADSMQVYDGLRLITARPSEADEIRIPHRLFGHISPHELYSVARWLKDAVNEIRHSLGIERQVIIVGGTGLYFSALTRGLSSVPEIDPVIRQKWREASEDPDADLHRQLGELDAKAAATLRPSDLQRITRALEVIESTGKSILEWQNLPKSPPIEEVASARKFIILPDRSLLHERINRRFDLMVEQGAIEEVEAFLRLGVDPASTAMKAIGVSQLASYLSGEINLSDACEKAKAASRQYAKRQYTWFRNQFENDWEILEAPGDVKQGA